MTPVSAQNALDPWVPNGENVMNNESDCSTDSAPEIENSPTKADMTTAMIQREYNASSVLREITIGEVIKQEGNICVKTEKKEPIQNTDVKDKAVTFRKRKLVVQMTDISKESKITFTRHMMKYGALKSSKEKKKVKRRMAQKCPSCESWIIGWSQMQTHKVFCKRLGQLQCKNCKARYYNWRSLYVHLKSCDSKGHLERKRKEREEKRRRKEKEREEKRKKEKKRPIKELRCPRCNKLLSHGDNILSHLKSADCYQKNRDKWKTKCMTCNKTFINKQYFLVHYVHVHLQGLDINDGVKWEYSSTEKSFLLHCLICGLGGFKESFLLKHFSEVHDVSFQYYSCVQCIAATCSYAELAKHWEVVHPMNLYAKCEVCFQKIIMADMGRHLEIQHSCFKCQKCKKFVPVDVRIQHTLICYKTKSIANSNT